MSDLNNVDFETATDAPATDAHATDATDATKRSWLRRGAGLALTAGAVAIKVVVVGAVAHYIFVGAPQMDEFEDELGRTRQEVAGLREEVQSAPEAAAEAVAASVLGQLRPDLLRAPETSKPAVVVQA